jgi:hypothetical protein
VRPAGGEDHGLPDPVVGRDEKVFVEELRPACRVAQHCLHAVCELRIEIDHFGRQFAVLIHPPDAVAGRIEEQLREWIIDQRIGAVCLRRPPSGDPKAVAPTLSLMSQVSSSLLAIGVLSLGETSLCRAYTKH